MIEVIFKDEVFKAKGSFSLGIAGVFVNEDFDDEMITFSEDMLDQINDRDDVEPLLPFIKSDDPDEIAKGLAEYCNQKEREIAANAKQINDCILYHLFADMEGCGYPFWEIKGAVLPDHPQKYGANKVYSSKNGNITMLSYYFDDKPNNGTLDKPDVEAVIRRLYPMFNLDGFIKSFEPESLYFNGKFISFQFSDGWGAKLACGAYDELDENFTFTDWHNH